MLWKSSASKQPTKNTASNNPDSYLYGEVLVCPMRITRLVIFVLLLVVALLLSFVYSLFPFESHAYFSPKTLEAVQSGDYAPPENFLRLENQLLSPVSLPAGLCANSWDEVYVLWEENAGGVVSEFENNIFFELSTDSVRMRVVKCDYALFFNESQLERASNPYSWLRPVGTFRQPITEENVRELGEYLWLEEFDTVPLSSFIENNNVRPIHTIYHADVFDDSMRVYKTTTQVIEGGSIFVSGEVSQEIYSGSAKYRQGSYWVWRLGLIAALWVLATLIAKRFS